MRIVRQGAWIIYVIHCEGFHKVGITTSLGQRLQAMELLNPFPIECVMHRYVPQHRARAVEKIVHAKLAGFRHRREWFAAPFEEIVAVVDAVIAVDKLRSGGWTAHDAPDLADLPVVKIIAHNWAQHPLPGR